MGNRWAVCWVCQLEHWQSLLGLLQCKYNFLRRQYFMSQSFQTLYINLFNSYYVIYITTRRWSWPLCLTIGRIYIASRKWWWEIFRAPSFYSYLCFPLPLYRGPVCRCCALRKSVFASKVPRQFSFWNENKCQKSCFIS